MIRVRHVARSDANAWLTLRHALWPEGSLEEHRAEIERFLVGRAGEPRAVLIAEDDRGELAGFAELSIRPYAEGCRSDRVAFLEGWYVKPACRRRGFGKALVAAAEQWGVAQGCVELASDAYADNELSLLAHRACGFGEVGVIRCFRKELHTGSPDEMGPDEAVGPPQGHRPSDRQE